jgi:hypothetical protein
VENPFRSMLNRFIEDEGQEGNCCETKLDHVSIITPIHIR